VTWSTGSAGCDLFKEARPKKEHVEINGAIRDVLELACDEVTKNGACVFDALRRDGKRVIAKYLFMSSYAARHPEYGALLAIEDGRDARAHSAFGRRYLRLSNA
jgi:hypothetical protein